MHFLHSAVQPCDPLVQVGPPRSTSDGNGVREPSITMYPMGSDTTVGQDYSLRLTADEAEKLGHAVLNAARESRELFPES